MKTTLLRFYVKTLWVLALLIASQAIMAQAQTISFDDSWGKQGISILNESPQSLKLNLSLEQYELHQTMVSRESMQTITAPGVMLQGEAGSPDLPVYSHYIAIPQGAVAEVNIINIRTETSTNVEIAPAPRIPFDTEQGPLDYNKNPQVYSANAFYPNNMVQVSEPMKIRGVDVVLVGISPFQYNPVTKELLVHRDIELEIEFKGGNGQFGETRLRSKWWDPIVRDMLLNEASLPQLTYNSGQSKGSREIGCEYLIITPDDATFLAWADSIRKFRVRQGITTKVMTTTEVGGNTTTAIESFVNDAYDNWDIPPVAVLLMADYGTSGNAITSPVWNSYCISDNIYSDVDGDHMPDMIFARMTAQNAGHLETMVTKFLNYERTPPTNPDFYDHPITAMGWQTERWFQICSESVAGFLENELGKSPVRENAIYQGNPGGGIWSTATNTSTVLNVFGESGLGYIEDDPGYLTDWGGNASRINADINDGAFLLQHRDHGYEEGWGEPSYSSSDINGLTNEDLCFIFSINCLTGKFNITGECFAEKFHRHQYGALGIIAATEISYSFVNDTYVWGLYDNMWTNFLPDFGTTPESRDVLPAFGNAAGKYFLMQSSWPYNTNNKEVTYNLFHHHGDAFTTVYYDMPQHLSVDFDAVLLSGMDYLTMTVNEGAFVCLTVNDEIISTAVSDGSQMDVPVPFQEPGTIVDIVITKQNYYRYENKIEVIPPDGAYCLIDECTINDTCGNGNTKPEFDEEILFSTIMKNLGNEHAVDVNITLTTNDNYVTIIDGDEHYDTIRIGEFVSREFAYKVHLSDGIPDQHQIEFLVVANDANDSTWISKFFMIALAPKIMIQDMVIDDSESGNDNGKLDAGETAILKLKTANKGSCVITDVECSLIAYNQFITIEEETVIIPQIGLLWPAYPAYNITVADDAPEAVIAQLNYYVEAAGYSEIEIFYPKIGMFLEDFETGDFEKYDWSVDGDEDWTIDWEGAYQGFFHAKSGDIGDNESCEFSINYNTMKDDEIKFYRKVSSEQNFDNLEFYIDNQLRGKWSGSRSWGQESYFVPEGNHTFKWVYEKDNDGIAGQDAAWVDYIELPTKLVTTLFAGPDKEICEGLNHQCEGSATNQNTISWSTSGDGTFNNSDILRPIYTPAEADYSAGNVLLTLEIIDNEGEEHSHEMVLTFIAKPDAPETPEGPDYVDVYKMIETEYSIPLMTGIDEYVWVLDPEEAGTLTADGINATVYWDIDYLGEAYLSVSAIGECGEGDYSEALIIFVDNTVGFSELDGKVQLSVAPNPNQGSFRVLVNTIDKDYINLKLINYLGMEVFAIDNIDASNGYDFRINKEGLPQGVYVVIVEQNGKYYSKKVLISR